MKKVPVIAVFVDKSREYGRGLLRGISRYSKLNGPWTFYLSPANYEKYLIKKQLKWLETIDIDGVVVYDSEFAKQIIDLGIPTILASSFEIEIAENVISVGSDPMEIANKSADYLINHGFKSFAFCGFKNTVWSVKRSCAFKQALNDNGYDCQVYLENLRKHAYSTDESDYKDFYRWLNSLNKPVAILACNDEYAHILIDICRTTQFLVPDDISVLGIDNDEMICELSNPTLTSIPLSTEEAGYCAAEQLMSMIKGKRSDSRHIKVSVHSPVERMSTTLHAIDDQVLRDALNYINSNAKRPLQVQDVAEEVGLNRRSLERKFKLIMGRTINEHIRKARVTEIIKLLTNSDMSITQIAERLGFSDVNHVARYFKKEINLNPSQYRRMNK